MGGTLHDIWLKGADTVSMRPYSVRSTRHRGSASRKPSSVLLSLLLLVGLVGMVPVLTATAAQAVPAAVSSGVSATHGFPDWYQDQSGTRLQPCLDPTDTRCVVLADAGFDPARPVSFPTNFPSEFFYSIVDSAQIATPGCSGTRRGTISMRFALEGAFANGRVVAGDQMTFGRIRLTITSGLCANSQYTVTHPFGQLNVTTDAAGSIARNQGTTDVGCVPVAPQSCDFTMALNAPTVKSFLRWDPTVAPAAPSGYLGDATTLHRVTGATYTIPGETAPANFIRVTGAKLSTPLTTNLFTVSGKLAGPLSARGSVDFGGQPVGTTSATTDVVVTNLAQNPVTASAASLTGVDAADFRVVNDGCAGVAVPRDATCTIGVAFAPSSNVPRNATLRIAHNGVGAALTVALKGTGTGALAQAEASAAPSSVDFGRQRIRTRSGVHQVTVSSTGEAPLSVSRISVAGADADQFTVVGDACTGTPVAVGSSCTVGVAFQPTVARPVDARLEIRSNDPASPVAVPLSALGYGGVAAVSPGLDAVNGMPDWYQDENATRLLQCIDPADPNCIVLAGGTFTGTGPLAFPGNYPDEWFYYLAESDQVPTDGCNGQSAPGFVSIRTALEAAFVNGDPVPGDQMTFGRIRVRASGLCPETEYKFVHPYGVETYTTDAVGGIKPAAGTQDVGCLAAGAGTACDFSIALQSNIFEGFVRWDPAVGQKAPAGYLGDAVTPHAIVGAPYTYPGDSSPANSFRILQGDQLVGETDQFIVMGKLGGPLVADATNVDFGNAMVGNPALDPAVPADTVTKPVRLTNNGTAPVTVSALTPAGAHAADFAVPATTDHCTGATLARGESCTADVAFTPGDVGDRGATLTVEHTGLNNPMSIGLAGLGTAFHGTPALSVDRTALSFADLHTGRISSAQRIVVSNRGGTAPLTVGTPTWAGLGAINFGVSANTCTQPVPAGETCTISVVYSPVNAQEHTASLTVTGEGSQPGSLTIQVSGTGFDGSSAVSPSVRNDGFPVFYQDGNGVRLEPCLEQATGRCVLLPDAGFNPAQPISFPGNFPGEFFYALADSDPVGTPGCNGTNPGTAQLRLALEGTFVGGAVTPGQQLVFGRQRVTVSSGLCPGATYTFTTPFGDLTGTANARGGLAVTQDIGCGAAPCAFTSALSSPVLDGFVRWAPGVGAAAPAGYLGDNVTPHEIVGATNLVGGEPANWFQVTDATGQSVGRTTKFVVSGRQASGFTGTDVTFADQQVTTTSAPRAVGFVNIARSAAPVARVELTGADAAAFSVVTTNGATTCPGSVVASDRSCAVAVAFAPAAVRTYTATVRLLAADGSVLGTAKASGQGIDAGLPRAAVTPGTLTFAAQRAGTTSTTQNVQVTNTGTGTLTLGALSFTGAQAGDFTATKGAACASLGANASCTIAVAFKPTGTGARTATLQIASNDPTGNRTVTVSGTGTASSISFGTTLLDFGKVKTGRSSTLTVNVTNNGTAPLNISAVALDAPANGFTATRGTCTTAVAVGRSCQLQVTFTASGAVGVRTTTLRVTSDALLPASLAVRGTVN